MNIFLFFAHSYRISILLLTFLTYTAYHMSRKPISVVKNVLSRNCSGLVPPPEIIITDDNRESWCDWAPFGMNMLNEPSRSMSKDHDNKPPFFSDGKNSQTLLGTLDSAFLFAYAAGMFMR